MFSNCSGTFFSKLSKKNPVLTIDNERSLFSGSNGFHLCERSNGVRGSTAPSAYPGTCLEAPISVSSPVSDIQMKPPFNVRYHSFFSDGVADLNDSNLCFFKGIDSTDKRVTDK